MVHFLFAHLHSIRPHASEYVFFFIASYYPFNLTAYEVVCVCVCVCWVLMQWRGSTGTGAGCYHFTSITQFMTANFSHWRVRHDYFKVPKTAPLFKFPRKYQRTDETEINPKTFPHLFVCSNVFSFVLFFSILANLRAKFSLSSCAFVMHFLEQRSEKRVGPREKILNHMLTPSLLCEHWANTLFFFAPFGKSFSHWVRETGLSSNFFPMDYLKREKKSFS